MFKTYDIKIDSIQDANIEALKLAKDVLDDEIEITPNVVAKFTALSGYPDLEVFIHTFEDDNNPFNDKYEYEENIYYLIYETQDIIRVTFEEFDRLMKIFIDIELERGLYINESEIEEYKKLIED